MIENIEADAPSLSDGIFRSRNEAGGIAIWYLGQSGFLLQHGGTTIAIDPYLSYAVDRLSSDGFWMRNYPPPVAPEMLACIDLVLCTHDHLDHTEPETLRGIAGASPNCHFAGPRASVERIRAEGIGAGASTTLRDGGTFHFRDVTIEPVAVAHESYETDAEGFDLFLGYLIHWRGLTLFHSGDTVVTPELAARLGKHRVDVAFLPINGRSDERHRQGIVGNMNAEEAVHFAAAQKMGLVVPVHYDLYDNNGADLAGFVSAWLKVPIQQRPRFKAFCPGERLLCDTSASSRPLAVIVGAGKTGRGFLARLLSTSPYEVVFVDVSEELVRRLNGDGSYAVHFFGAAAPPWRAQDVTAAVAGSDRAVEWLGRAEVVFIAVGETNVAGVARDLARALDQRRQTDSASLQVFVCENGASPAAPLRAALRGREGEIEISEAAIFCSTIELPGTRLDIQSESYERLPYDATKAKIFHPLPGMDAVADFPALLQRKIYTYNCYSACIAYLGAYKGFVWYADAARDGEISAIIDQVAGPLNRAIAQRFAVGLEEQHSFSDAALRKFRDTNIRDDIARNARHVARKLGPNDRLIQPYRLIVGDPGATRALALTMAAALLYRGSEEAELQAKLERLPVEKVLGDISGCDPQGELARSVAFYYERLGAEQVKGPSLLEILSSLDSASKQTGPGCGSQAR